MKENIRELDTDDMINLIKDFLSLDNGSSWITTKTDTFSFKFTGHRYSVLNTVYKWIERRVISEEKVKFVKCYYPPINKIHLSDYILVPKNGVYEYTKQLFERLSK